MKVTNKKGIQAEIIHDVPPNYDELVAVFGEGANWDRGATFTYAEGIYCKDPLPEHLVAHELIHVEQQEKEGGTKAWWKRYIEDPDFRLHEEIEAYRAEYNYVVRYMKKHQHFYYLRYFAMNLSKRYKLGVDLLEAINLIKNENTVTHKKN